jgi:hypothetical protein
MKNSNLIGRAILNSLGVLIYVSLVSLILNNGEKVFGQMNKIIGPSVFLMLFVLSASVTGGLVLGKPILLYLEGFKKEGIKLFIYTGLSLLALILLSFMILFLMK